MDRIRNPLIVVTLASFAACSAPGKSSSFSDSAAATSAAAASAGSLEGPRHGGMPGMQGMAGMQGMMGGAAMDSMQAQMRTMAGMGPEQAKAMLPMHRQQAANMLSQMNADMKAMNMTADASWTATADSIRQDLVHMPDWTARQLADAMPAHQARMTRLMQMHRGMMGSR